MAYKFFKEEDKYYITNEAAVSLVAVVSKLKNCVDYVEEETFILNPFVTMEIELNGDGLFTIVVDNVDTIYVKNYLYLQLSILGGTYNTVCNCQCGCGCEEQTKEKELCNLLMLRTKIDAYKRLTYPVGQGFYDIVNQHTKNLIEKPVYCAIDSEAILGEADCNIKLTKQLIALDYLAMYFSEIKQVEETELDYVSTKYLTTNLFCCIQELGIDVGEIETLINDNMGTLTINSGAYVNLPPSAVGDNTIAVANRATSVLSLAQFTTNTTPAYTDPEGDAAKEVRIDTLPADGTLTLNGIPVTAGQIIPVADINANLLVFTSPNQDALDGDDITFSISDVGSGLFSS